MKRPVSTLRHLRNARRRRAALPFPQRNKISLLSVSHEIVQVLEPGIPFHRKRHESSACPGAVGCGDKARALALG